MNSRILGWVILPIALIASNRAVASTIYYVDGKNGVAGNPGTQALPFPTIFAAEKVAQPGDTIHLLPTMTYSQLGILTSGTAGAPITYLGGDATTTVTAVTGQGATDQDNGIWINSDYIVVKNFSVTAPGPYSAIQIAGNHHHIWIKNNILHDSGGDGISSYENDYLWLTHNTVYGNAKYTQNCVFGSGISVLASIDIDNTTSVKTTIVGNIVYQNTNTITAACRSTDSDGNGIIIDTNNGQSDGLPYNGRTLIANNVVYGNGGRGIHVYRSNHVTITSNSTYYNNQDPAEGNYLPGEIEANSSGDISVYDNILYSDGAEGEDSGKYTGNHVGISFQNCPALGSGSGALTAEYNLIYNPKSPGDPLPYEVASCRNTPTIPVTIAGNIWANPQYAVPSATSGGANFDIQATSPALGAANFLYSASFDINGNPRPVTLPVSGAYTPPTDGAYEIPAR